MSAIPLYRRLAFRLAFTSTLLVAVSIAGFGFRSYQREHQAIEERFGAMLHHIVATAALDIDGDAHRLIQTMEDTRRPEFEALREQLRRVQQVNELREDLIYTVHIDPDGSARAAVMLQEVPYTGDRYQVPPANALSLHDVRASLKPAHSGIYKDLHGQWVSAFAPILDSEGHFAGMLEADFDVSEVNAALDRELSQILGLSGSLIILSLLLSAVLARRLEAALQQIRLGAQAIEEGRYEVRVAVTTEDELGLVARNFNRMAEVLSERFHLLKYVPEHTLDSVRRQVQEGFVERTERLDATVLFTDIRGYTALSEGLTDEALVAILHGCLRVQAEEVAAAGGTVDKFIGDAVFAVFTGEDHVARAVGAALAIQEALERRQESEEVPVGVGIGVATGSLVMAELGSAERRERTPIGSTVNLASRLCSLAGAGEVVATQEVVDALGERVEVRSAEEVTLKGFEGARLCSTIAALR